jgi:hypothetical protein
MDSGELTGVKQWISAYINRHREGHEIIIGLFMRRLLKPRAEGKLDLNSKQRKED